MLDNDDLYLDRVQLTARGWTRGKRGLKAPLTSAIA